MSNCYVIRKIIPDSANFISKLILLSEDCFCTTAILSEISVATALNAYQRIYFKQYLKLPDSSLLTVLNLPDN